MVVVVLEKVPLSLRVYLSRWLIEVNTGTFVGTLRRRERDFVQKGLPAIVSEWPSVRRYTAWPMLEAIPSLAPAGPN